MNTTITNTIGPLIRQSFDKNLLTKSVPPTSQVLMERHQSKINRKYKKNSRNMKKFEEILKLYEELYGWIQAQKAYEKSKNKTKEKKPDIPIREIDRSSFNLRKNIRTVFMVSNFKRDLPESWRNSKI